VGALEIRAMYGKCFLSREIGSWKKYLVDKRLFFVRQYRKDLFIQWETP
jgi:hypothetical protein